jgi:ubiquinone/menaquinone biosynthesis C-methylase UbiE
MQTLKNKQTDTSSNKIWSQPQGYAGYEQREYRFTEEMRPLFFKWLGIKETCHILDAGCGTGVFGRYLAKGLSTGRVTGFDINEGFIEYGRKRLEELGLSHKMTIEKGDGFNLHYADGTFDAVTDYTYLGVLSDPMAGLKEKIRVCKPGGWVSCVVSTMAVPNIWWLGDYDFDGARELQQLAALEDSIHHKYVWQAISASLNQGKEWHERRYLKLFDLCGLTDIQLHPYAYTINYNDSSLPFEYRKNLLYDETNSEIGYLAWRYGENKAIYKEHGFGDAEFERLTELLKVKLEYISKDFADDRSYEWRGGFNFVVAGKKAI